MKKLFQILVRWITKPVSFRRVDKQYEDSIDGSVVYKLERKT